MSDLFTTGVRPAVDQWLADKAAEKRDYGEYWSGSSAGYCMRKNIFERLKVPYVKEDVRKTRVFAVGDVFHTWMQNITKQAGLSIAQELELQDEDLMIRGHIDDLVLITPYPEEKVGWCMQCGKNVGKKDGVCERGHKTEFAVSKEVAEDIKQHLILYDYKSQSSRAFSYKRPNMSHFHRMQLGTYMYMLRLGAKAELARRKNRGKLPPKGIDKPISPDEIRDDGGEYYNNMWKD